MSTEKELRAENLRLMALVRSHKRAFSEISKALQGETPPDCFEPSPGLVVYQVKDKLQYYEDLLEGEEEVESDD